MQNNIFSIFLSAVKNNIFFTSCFVLILTSLFTTKIFGQINSADSFKNLIDRTTTDLEKVNQLLRFSEYLIREKGDDSTCLLWLEKAENISAAIKYPFGISKSNLLKGDYYFNTSKWTNSIQSYKLSIQYAGTIADRQQKNELLFKGSLNLAEVYNYNGDYVTALEHRLKTIAHIDSIDTDAGNRTNAYLSIANDFRHLNQRSKAIEYLEKAKPFLQDTKDNVKLDYYYEYYQNLLLNGRLEESQEILAKFDSAVKYFDLSKTQKLEFSGMSHKLHGQFELNYNKNYQASLNQFMQYLQLSKQQNNQTHTAIALNKIGIVYDSLMQYKLAIAAFKQSYEICIKEKIIDYGYKSAFELATVYEKSGDYKNAY
ncbi:hypothetical protein BH11BAC4_BH11BAC4_09420 [soil metagenome]